MRDTGSKQIIDIVKQFAVIASVLNDELSQVFYFLVGKDFDFRLAADGSSDAGFDLKGHLVFRLAFEDFLDCSAVRVDVYVDRNVKVEIHVVKGV